MWVRRPCQLSGTVNVLRYEPTGLSSSGTRGKSSGGKGYWTLVYIGLPYRTPWPDSCICQLAGTVTVSHPSRLMSGL